jgi:hypothetical protein
LAIGVAPNRGDPAASRLMGKEVVAVDECQIRGLSIIRYSSVCIVCFELCELQSDLVRIVVGSDRDAS